MNGIDFTLDHSHFLLKGYLLRVLLVVNGGSPGGIQGWECREGAKSGSGRYFPSLVSASLHVSVWSFLLCMQTFSKTSVFIGLPDLAKKKKKYIYIYIYTRIYTYSYITYFIYYIFYIVCVMCVYMYQHMYDTQLNLNFRLKKEEFF